MPTEKPAGHPIQGRGFEGSEEQRFRGRNVPGESPAGGRLTRPYFSRPNIEQPYYTINNPEYLNLPLAPYPLEAWAEFSYEGAQFRVGQVVQTVKRVTGYGPVLEPLTVGPPVAVSISPRAGIVPLDTRSFVVTALLHSNLKGPATGNVRLQAARKAGRANRRPRNSRRHATVRISRWRFK